MPLIERPSAPLTDAVVQIIGKDSNAFVILGYVRRCILSSNHPELADDFMREATAGDYNHLLIIHRFTAQHKSAHPSLSYS